MLLNKIKAALTVLEGRKMTVEELENKARDNSLVYDTKYSEDGVLEEMLSRPQDFVDGAIMEIVQLLRKKANRDGFIAGAKELQEKNDQLIKYCKELEAGFLNYKKNYKTKRQKVYELETKIENLEKENEKLKSINKKMQCCKNCKKYRMLESQVSLSCLNNRIINLCCEEWEFGE